MNDKELSGKDIKTDAYEPERNKDAKFGVTAGESLNSVTGLTRAQLEASINEIERITMQEDVVPMVESLFEGYFLRTLAGLDEDKDARIIEFYRGGGGLHKPVNIVDRAGHFLFQVPPLYKTNHINALVKGDSPSVTAIVTAAHILVMNRPQQALEDISNGLLSKFTQSNRKGFVYAETEKAWKAIFARYGILEEVEAKAQKIIEESGLLDPNEKKDNKPHEQSTQTTGKPNGSNPDPEPDFLEDAGF